MHLRHAPAARHPLNEPTAGKIHWKNTIEQLDMVGPRSLGVCLLTAAFVGMVFTIQFIR
jgi:ABC-type transporter Mla maintaining outer membrane lipid asymmetry permease subunit MlaE